MNGAGGLRAKPEVLAGPVNDYKALVAAHDLFTAGCGSWSLHKPRLLPLLPDSQAGDGKQAVKGSWFVLLVPISLRNLRRLQNPDPFS